MSNLLLFIGGLLAIVLGGLFAVPHYVDWNSYRGVFEEEATRILGREVRVRGSVSLRLLPRPYVSFEKIRIADSRSGTGGAFFGAESFTLWLAVPPLLKRTFQANQIEIKRPILRLRIDKDGGGNWEDLGPKQGASTLLPQNVALDTVKISDGQVRIVNADGQELFLLDAINGTFSAPSLQGPFKLRTFAKFNGRERDIRMSTSKRRDDGSLRLRGTVRLPDSGNSYTFDGQVKDVLQHPRLTGTVLARIWSASADKAASAPTKRGHPIEMKASVQADALSAKLNDIAISFEHDGKPQLLTGKAATAWRQGLVLDADLEARWLDLDRISRGNNKTPFATTHAFLTKFGELLPQQGRSRVTFKVDQANLGGDVVSALHLAISKLAGEFKISDLSASTPGGSRIKLAGVLSGTADQSIFDGRLRLRGVSLSRFLGWAVKDAGIAKSTSPIYFDLNTDILAAADSLSARKFNLELPKSRLTGTGRYHWGNFASLALSLSADHLDLAPFLADGATLTDVKKLVGLLHNATAGKPGTRADKGEPVNAFRRHLLAALANAHVKIQAGRLKMGGTGYRDVKIDAALAGGNLVLSHVKSRSDDGLILDVRGKIEKVGTQPKGRLSVALSAANTKAVERLAMLLNVPLDDSFTIQRISALAPLRLAGGIDLGFRLPKSADFALHGDVRDGKLSLSARMDGGLQALKTGHIELTGELDSRDAAALMTQLAPAAGKMALSGNKGGATNKGGGRFSLRASGVPATGLTSALSMESTRFNAAFKGTTRFAKGPATFDGDLSVTLADARHGLALIGLDPLPELADISLQGRSRISGKSDGIRFSALRAKLAGVAVRGSGEIRANDAKYTVKANLKTASLNLRRFLGLLQGAKVEPATPSDGDDKDIAKIWTDAPIEFAPLAHVDGTLHLAADVLKLSPGLNLRASSLIAKLSPGKLQFSDIKGTALTGTFKGGLIVSKTPGGASLKGSFVIDKARLEQLVRDSDGKPAARGAISASLNFAGAGLSLRGISGVLQGKGWIKIGDVNMRRMTPSAVGDAADAVITGKEPGGTMAELISGKLNSGQLAIPARTIPLKISDGSLTAEPINLDGPRARIVATNTLDLTSFMIDSKWNIEPKNSVAGKRALPSVGINYTGSIGVLASLEPKIRAGALEREIAVRRLEYEAGELERLRKLDEERAERERRRLEQVRLERERLAREREVREREAREREARVREALEREARERSDRERLERERLDRERLKRERSEQARLARERSERERLVRERSERERLGRERLNRERLERERLARERLKRERSEQARLARERLERSRLGRERLKRERLARERQRRKLQPPAATPIGPGIAPPESTGLQEPGTLSPGRGGPPILEPPLQLPGSSGLLRARPQ